MTEEDKLFEGSIARPWSSTDSPLASDTPDLLYDEGRGNSNLAASNDSVSHGTLSATTPQKSRSMFDFSSGKLQASPISTKDEEKDDSKESKTNHTTETLQGERSFNFRSWLSADLEQEAQEVVSRRRDRRPSAGIESERNGALKSEKVKQKRDTGSKERNARQSEMKSLMEQVASIAAQSRGIMRAQPKQTEEQKLMGEIIAYMGKMADKLSKLMLVTEPKDVDDEIHTRNSVETSMTEEVADEKAEQILALLAKGDDSYELEWKRLEIKTILTSETNHPRKRISDKRRALDGLALDEPVVVRSSSAPKSRSSRSLITNKQAVQGNDPSNRSQLNRAMSSKSTGSRSRRSHGSRRSSSMSVEHLNFTQDTVPSTQETTRPQRPSY